MNEGRLKGATIARQVLAGYAAALVATAVIVIVASLALRDAVDAKNSVIDRDLALVTDAYRLETALDQKSISFRTFLLTGDDQYLAAIPEIDDAFEAVFAEMEANVHTDTGRRLLNDLRTRKGEWDEATTDLIDAVQDESLAGDQVPAALEERVVPVRQILAGTAADLVRQEERLAEVTLEKSDDRASDATRNVVLLGITAAAAVLVLGVWLTRRINRRLTGLALTID